MEIIFQRNLEVLSYHDVHINAWNKIRSLENGRRQNSEVVYTSPSHEPYDPHLFPLGKWKILGIVEHKANEPYLFPYFIQTDAWQYVNVWDLDASGLYGAQSDRKVADYDYGIHFSSSRTTLGCIRIEKEKDLRNLVAAIRASTEPVTLEVMS